MKELADALLALMGPIVHNASAHTTALVMDSANLITLALVMNYSLDSTAHS